MKPNLHLIFIAIALLQGSAAASDLELRVRTHASEIVFGDPIYVEVTIVNRGKETVIGPHPAPDLSTLDFFAYDPRTRLRLSIADTGGAAGGQPVKYEPGVPIRSYWMLFVPDLRQTTHPFWMRIRDGQTIRLYALYYLGGGLSLQSNTQELNLKLRDDEELRFLQRWAWADSGDPDKGPLAVHLGLQLRAFTPRQTLRIANSLQEGEIKDMLELTLKLQALYLGPPELLDSGTRHLVDWLSKQPDIKRQVLLDEAISVAQSHLRLFPTAAALEELKKRP